MYETKRQQSGDEPYQALRSQTTVALLTERESDIPTDDAHFVPLRLLNPRNQADGEKVVGKKIGVTSEVVQEMLGVRQPDFGFLTDVMEFPEGADIPIAGTLIQPRAEAEIGFRLKKDLNGPGVTERDVLRTLAAKRGTVDGLTVDEVMTTELVVGVPDDSPVPAPGSA
jgi:2-oxopent-4-enoate/cis-2-oxohex-4-enoate hydratase